MVTSFRRIVLALSISMVLVVPCSRAAAQDVQPAAAQPADAAPQQPAPGDAAAQTSHGRVLGVIPDFLTVNDSSAIRPLTTRQKYNVVSRTAFDWFQFGWYTAKSGIDQWNGSEDGYGYGVQGYGKRWAANFADGTAENYFVGAVWPSVFHQDPRYFRKAMGSVGARAGYSVTRVLVTRGDSGRHQFNLSELLGATSATLLSNTYHPAGDRTVGNNIQLMTLLISYDMVANLMKEFWPDISNSLARARRLQAIPR